MIERTFDQGILTLRLAHRKASALDVELLEALLCELDAVADEVQAVVLTGTGSIFCAGVDLFRITDGGPEYVSRFLPLLSRFVRALFAFPKPIVAAVNGHAIAGGCIIVLACDFRIMVEGDARIGVPELLVGVPFPAAPIEVVRFAVPRDKAQALVYTGRTVQPREAIEAGLIDEVVAADQLSPRALEVARQLALIPTRAFTLTKEYLRAEALGRIDAASETRERGVLEEWSSPETLAHIRDYLHRTLGR
jgi:enoyl-CoA hydratase